MKLSLAICTGLSACALIVAAPASAQITICLSKNYSKFGANLDQGMNESAVATAVGARPKSVSLETCGQNLASGPWACKIESWGTLTCGALTVYFQKSASGEWVVVSWQAEAPLSP